MNGRTILVVDDDPGFLLMCRELLEAGGYAVVTASSGTAAIRTLDAKPEVDLVIVDIFMPDRDGFEVIAFVRGRHPRPPIVAMSGGGCWARLERTSSTRPGFWAPAPSFASLSLTVISSPRSRRPRAVPRPVDFRSDRARSAQEVTTRAKHLASQMPLK